MPFNTLAKYLWCACFGNVLCNVRVACVMYLCVVKPCAYEILMWCPII